MNVYSIYTNAKVVGAREDIYHQDNDDTSLDITRCGSYVGGDKIVL